MNGVAFERRRSRGTGLALRAAGVWVGFAAIATVAGIVRETYLVPAIGERPAHQVGTLLVVAAFWCVIAAFARRTRLTPAEGATIGLVWLAAAIAFEFGFGHYVDGLSWARLLADYDLTRGRLLLLLWLTVGVGPFVMARRGQREAGARGLSAG